MMLGFLADSSQGTIFIKSVDVSDSIADVDGLFLLIDEVIDEIGPDNVVQVITYRVSHIMESVGKKISEKHRKIFWTVCASHCISLILDRIKSMDHVVDVLDKAKSITKTFFEGACTATTAAHPGFRIADLVTTDLATDNGAWLAG